MMVCKKCNDLKEIQAKGLCKECYDKQYSNANKIKKALYDKQYKTKNKPKINLYVKSYIKSDINKLKHKFAEMLNRCKREYSVTHNIKFENWRDKINATNGICPVCLKNVGINKITMDHNPALSKAPKKYEYKISNLEPKCLSCNSKNYKKQKINYEVKNEKTIDFRINSFK